MKKLLTISITLVSFLCATGNEISLNYTDAYAKWEEIAYSDKKQNLDNAFEFLDNAWKALSDSEKKTNGYYFARATFKTAQSLAAESKFQESARILKQAGQVAQTFSIDLSRGRSESNLVDLFSLHTLLQEKLDIDPLDDIKIGYEHWKTKQGFKALQENSVVDVIPQPKANLDEIICIMLSRDNDSDKVRIIPVSVKKGSGSLRSRLSAIYDLNAASPDGPAKYRRTEITNDSNHSRNKYTPSYWPYILGAIIIVLILLFLKRNHTLRTHNQ